MNRKVIAVDLDGTLAHSLPVFNPEIIGDPIERMVARVEAHIKAGDKIVIFSARVAEDESITPAGTTNKEFAAHQRALIESWCEKTFSQVFEVTAIKSPLFDLIYDDRAAQIIPDQGETVYEALGRLNVEKIVKRQIKKSRVRK